MRLEKYHGLGNDFLILLDPDEIQPIDEDLTRRVCDRHRGVGADGLIRVTPGTDSDLTMELRNADGGPAEISGNGIRCVALAAVDGKLVAGPHFTVRSAARIYDIRVGEDGSVGVDMGPADVTPERPFDTAGWKAREVDLGNPHLVLLCPDPAAVHVAELGSQLEKLRPGGLNVEFMAAGPETDTVTVRLWERGAGETEASGSGSCASAAAAHAWALVGPSVTVHNPGGDLHVDIGETVVLTGPAEHIATVELAS